MFPWLFQVMLRKKKIQNFSPLFLIGFGKDMIQAKMIL